MIYQIILRQPLITRKSFVCRLTMVDIVTNWQCKNDISLSAYFLDQY